MNFSQFHAFVTDEYPSDVLETMHIAGTLDPEIHALIGVKQDTIHHPEGCAYAHTLMVVDEAANLARIHNLGYVQTVILRLAALCHDFGKPDTTVIHEDGRITAHGHPDAGVRPTFDFLARMHIPTDVVMKVSKLVQYHMAQVGYYTPDITTRAVRRLLQNISPVNIDMLALVIESDIRGRGVFHESSLNRLNEIVEVARNIDNKKMYRPEPFISGDDIMRILNIQPSPQLGAIKTDIYNMQLAGKFADANEALQYLLVTYTITI